MLMATTSPALEQLPWQQGFATLGTAFFTDLSPSPLPAPYWVASTPALAADLGLPEGWLHSDQALQALSGNIVLPGSQPLASVYSGHQFGVWAGQLGDGRAILLGELNGQEVQLKGSGLTPYSRMGDGRAVLRSSIREFLCSEAMHALGVPSTRALCLTGSPQPVRRETLETAAVVTRTAPSFIRFGHFEHFAARRQYAELRTLTDYVIERYYPECAQADGWQGNRYAALLHAVSERTAALLAQWQALGFCHGVMNTDNMSILGLTIDYGPFQFLDGYDPGHICNHSDHRGRYAFDQQPGIAYWNLHCLARALLPLIDDAELAQQALDSYEAVFEQAFLARMCAKLGLPQTRAEAAPLLLRLSRLLGAEKVDYPIFWRRLSQAVTQQDFVQVRDLFLDAAGIDDFLLSYQELTAHMDKALQANLMLKNNPRFVLRNHLAELAIRAAEQGDFLVLRQLQTVLADPFDEHPGLEALANFPPDWASTLSISCSS